MGAMDRMIYETYDSDQTRLGQLYAESIKRYFQTYIGNYQYAQMEDAKTLMETILLGDPTLRIYKPNSPETLKVPEDCATIQGAINAAYDGDTILVSSGTYYENLIVSKSVSLIGENKSNTIIDGNLAGNVINITASSVTVSGFTVRRSNSTSYTSGICANSGSAGNNVSGNTITDNGYGIFISYSSSNNSICGNNITANSYDGVYLSYCSNNSICGNNITANGHNGVRVAYCSNNSICGNNITANSYDGVYVSGLKDPASNNSICGNNITANSYDGVYVEYCSNNSIYGNNIADNVNYGIYLYYSSSSSISGNSITNNSNCGLCLSSSSHDSIIRNNIMNNDWDGVILYSSSNNSVSGNSITNNSNCGVILSSSSDNSIYHNNFVGNIQQAYSNASANVWDEDYPSGGNYWSDYAGVDVKRGHFQNEAGSDGIGDSAYIIDSYEYLSSIDRYPLMKPYAGPHDIGITNITTSKSVVGQNYTLETSIRILNCGIDTETFNLTAYANTTIIAMFTGAALQGRNSTDITFIWNTTGFAKGNYVVSVYVWPVPNETDTMDNTLVGGSVIVTIPGDVNGDFTVDIYDAIILAGAYNSVPTGLNWKANADINSDDIVDIYDAIILAGNYGKTA